MSAPGTGPAPDAAVLRWLRGDATDRARYADGQQRALRRLQQLALIVCAAALSGALWYGPVLAALVGLGVAALVAGRIWHRHTTRPEKVTAWTFFALEIDLALGVLVTGGADSPLLPLLVVPVVSQVICFRPQVLVAAVITVTALLAPAVAFAPLLPAVPAAPGVLRVLVFAALLICLTLAAHHLASAEVHSRDEAVADPMTGLLNRLTLSTRFTIAERDAAAIGGSIGVVMCDVDHFKRVNDTYGHDRGDQVLVELAALLRANLRVTDVAYRVGGEEFVLLLPGRERDGAIQVAERVRRAVESSPLAGLEVTISAGVASVRAGEAPLAELLRQADGALYAAKGAGRNRVVSTAEVAETMRAVRAAQTESSCSPASPDASS